jgi:hypothetical protein
MLFFIKAELRSMPPMPREQWLGMTVSTWEAIKQLENTGCVIADVASHEELADLLNRLPLFAYLEWTVVPMIPAQSALDGAKWALQHGATAPTR